MYMIKEQKSERCKDSIIKLIDDTYCEARKFIKLNNDEIYALVISVEIDGSCGSKIGGDKKITD